MIPPAPPVSFWNVYSTERVLGRAPATSNAFTTAAWFSVAASISAVWPRNFSAALTSAFASSSSLTESTLPERAASISGVSPSPYVASGLAPARRSALTTGALPMVAAS